MNPIKYAKLIGVHIEDGVKLIDNPNWGSEPYLIWIGEGSLISGNVAFVTHDMSTRVFKKIDSDKKIQELQKYGKIVIGKNCFIGMRSMILPNVTIGDNSIVAAGAVVTKSIPSEEVWGGIPAKRIMSLTEYKNNCLKSCLICETSELESNKKFVLENLLSSRTQREKNPRN